MPAHDAHRFCASVFGLPSSVSLYVDNLIDSGSCFGHDIGLEDTVIVSRGGEEAKPMLGIHALVYCLYRDGAGEEHLKASIIHILLDCIDRKIRSHFRKNAVAIHKALQQCVDFVENRLKHSIAVLKQVEHRNKLFLPLPPETLAPLIQKLLLILYEVARIEKEKLMQCVEIMLRHY
jgi:hypothetical protein